MEIERWPHDLRYICFNKSYSITQLDLTTLPSQTPELQNLVLLPLMTVGHDAALEQLTAGRIPCLPPDSIPNYLRTKLDPDIEKYEQDINSEVRINSNRNNITT